MKTTITSVFVLLALLLVASPALGQDKAKKGSRAGVGMSLGSGDVGALKTLHIPVLINPQFRIEPTFSFVQDSQTTSVGDSSSSLTTTQIGASLGAFYNWRPSKTSNTHCYVGLRAGILRDTSETTVGGTTAESVRQDIIAGPALGGEYFFAKTFSIGGEVQINYTKIGDTEVTAGGSTSTETADSDGISTDTLMAVRWYFL